jgi:hypothetical protein
MLQGKTDVVYESKSIYKIAEMNKNTHLTPDLDDEDLKKLLSASSGIHILNSYDDYVFCLQSFYTEYRSNNTNLPATHYPKFKIDASDKNTIESVNRVLHRANYDENSLSDENIILFEEPVIMSELYCTSVPDDESTGVVRLISRKGADKKFTLKKATIKASKTREKDVTSYEINDVVFGVILPKDCSFHSVKIAKYSSLLIDHKKLELVNEALLRAQEAPLIEMELIKKNFNKIESAIEIKLDKFEALNGDIKVLELERVSAQSSLENATSTLTKIHTDLAKASTEHASRMAQTLSQSTELEKVKVLLNTELVLLEKEKVKLIKLENETKHTSVLLSQVKNELADANREKNLSNLDMAGHSNETSRQLRPYYALTLLIFAGLSYIATYIYRNGESFTSILPSLINVSAWDILISRLPLIAATALIIGGLSATFFYLIRHIVSLNTEKMTMLKAAILAEQITNSLDCKDMSPQEQLEFKRDTKIKLIMQVFTSAKPELENSNLIIEVLRAANSK